MPRLFPQALVPAAVAFFAILPSEGRDIPWESLVGRYCLDCHDSLTDKGGVDLETLLDSPFPDGTDHWERVLRQLDARQMPPVGEERPGEAEYAAAVASLAGDLDEAARRSPRPGRTDSLRRLTRFEYENAIRDLLALEIDASELLPADEASHGFDNITVGELSPALLDRYLSAAQVVSRLALGAPVTTPESRTLRIPPDRTQEWHVEGLPPGTRGGGIFRHHFPRDGEYRFQVHLTRDRNELVEGMEAVHEMEFLLDGEPRDSLTLRPPKNRLEHTGYDADLTVRFAVEAGTRAVGITFVAHPFAVAETLRQPYEAHFNYHRHPRRSPALYQLTITGPFADAGPGDTPSRRKLLATRPDSPSGEGQAARANLARLLRHAWRRPVTAEDVDRLLPFFAEGREAGGTFDAGMESALAALLVSPEFLFRVERDPDGIAPATPYPVDDFALATRLSFFLWSSLPDEELLTEAEKGTLSDPDILESHARRLLADPRSRSLVTSFADQWLHLRNLETITPDGRLFPGFDDNLREAFRRETEEHVRRIIREDRRVLDLIDSGDTFLNQRLARHYGIPHIHGSHFRPVSLGEEITRGGILRQGSLLTVTSYATRTSPVIRGNWILENLLGSPPPPPPDVPALEDNSVSAGLPIRERLAEHRKQAACASCHNLIDPVGFALEHFDATGQWRTRDNGHPVDARGGLSDGSTFVGVVGLEEAILERPDRFVRTLSEKLLTYALGRGIEPSDGPAVREIVRASEEDDYRFSSLVTAIVRSEPFRMRMSDSPD